MTANPLIVRLAHPVTLFDSIGLSIFAVAGAQKAMIFGHNSEVAVLLGVVTAVGGGVARESYFNRVPAILQRENLRVLPRSSRRHRGRWRASRMGVEAGARGSRCPAASYCALFPCAMGGICRAFRVVTRLTADARTPDCRPGGTMQIDTLATPRRICRVRCTLPPEHTHVTRRDD
jgi:hypothetical protein